MRFSFLALFAVVIWRCAGGYKLLLTDEVSGVLYDIQLEQYIPNFRDQGFERILELGTMTEQDLIENVGIALPGHRKRILMHVAHLRTQLAQPSSLWAAMSTAAYWGIGIGMGGLLTAGVLTCVMLSNATLRQSVLDSVSVTALIFWYHMRKMQRDRRLPDILCKMVHRLENLYYSLVNTDQSKALPSGSFDGHSSSNGQGQIFSPRTLPPTTARGVTEACEAGAASTPTCSRRWSFRGIRSTNSVRAGSELPTSKTTISWGRRRKLKPQ